MINCQICLSSYLLFAVLLISTNIQFFNAKNTKAGVGVESMGKDELELCLYLQNQITTMIVSVVTTLGFFYVIVYIITQECCEQYWTSPGGKTPQGTSYTANCLPSRKLYKVDEPDTQDTAGEARTNSSVMYSYGPLHMAKQEQDDQLEHAYSSYMKIRDVSMKNCQKQWMIGRSGERGSEISMLAARHDDDDDI